MSSESAISISIGINYHTARSETVIYTTASGAGALLDLMVKKISIIWMMPNLIAAAVESTIHMN